MWRGLAVVGIKAVGGWLQWVDGDGKSMILGVEAGVLRLGRPSAVGGLVAAALEGVAYGGLAVLGGVDVDVEFFEDGEAEPYEAVARSVVAGKGVEVEAGVDQLAAVEVVGLTFADGVVVPDDGVLTPCWDAEGKKGG